MDARFLTKLTKKDLIVQLNELLPVWLKTESELATSDRSDNDDPNIELTKTLLRDYDARRAEAIALHQRVHPLQLLRVLIERGHFARASETLEELKGELTAEDSAASVEIYLEEARLLGHRGEWSRAAEICEKAIRLEPPTVTLMALLQVRSLAHFELGEFEKALSDIESLECLSKLFPKAASLLYSRITRIKILVRTRAKPRAERELKNLWENIQPTPDSVLSLLRLEIDLRRLEGRDYGDLARACLWLSEKMGEALYSALARLDSYFLRPSLTERKSLESVFFEFPKVQRILEEVEGTSSFVSTTSQSIREFRTKSKAAPQTREREPHFELLILPKAQILVSEKEGKLHFRKLKKRKQLFVAAENLSEGPISKERFFAKQWGKSRYVPLLHDGLIRTLVCRLRKEMRVDILSENGSLRTEGVLLVRF
jgi:tetratricopeptide (TPR) repeat protein